MLTKILPFLFLFGCCQADPSITLREFVRLIPYWEVPANSPITIVGDNGAAYGHYQIHAVMVEDYNRITGSKAAHTDAFDPVFSENLAYAILSHYSKHMSAQGIAPTTDHLLYIWNGGGGAWQRVENPQDDQKQVNLKKYRRKANPIILRYLASKKARTT
jgi:hypothetical protein